MSRYWVLLMAVSLANRPAAAQSASAQLNGAVLGESGTPLAGARIVYTRKPQLVVGSDGKLHASPGESRSSSQAISDVSGKYRIPNLPPGDYDLCMDAPGYLATCEWTGWRRVTVAQGQAFDNSAVQLAKAATVTIRINDALLLLKPANGMTSPLLVGVRDAWGRFHPGHETAVTGASRTFQVDVPYGTTLNLWLHSWRFLLTDSSGAALNRAGAQFPFQVAASSVPPSYVFNIAGEASGAK